MPRLSALSGFGGYYLIGAADGVLGPAEPRPRTKAW